jgi:hypothetical protein
MDIYGDEPEPEDPSQEGPLGDLLPWQRFVLALLLFFDVALAGMLFLIIIGHVEFN